ncbi:MFS transporter [Acrocarpospora phusangensis]|uniref:MFS transporter n=1 Tax=Acrocarpospora phusangensis TaxID=1070424 RepID=A0A919QKM6_9ACTN|nr:MFS transporter [Acrocarpospora phusangensis]GIH29205.1 MFS transporter [Acrocarpospora phusangensis]
MARGGRRVGRATRRLTYAQGAGRTGLGRLIELTAAHSAGDAFITVSLAGALFFGLPVGQARGQVALYLLITMVPFTVVAPFVGPVLDRFRSGRRYVMAGTLFARGLLCWGMASSVVYGDTLSLFPAALAVLVLSKAYNVSRAAIMPSVLPADITLVTANARVALFALVAAGGSAAAAAGLTAWIGAEWVLRGAMALFLICGVVAVRLPRHVDSPEPEEETPAPGWRTWFQVGPVVAEAMRANAAIRVQAGFLVFFLLFLVQDKHLPGLAPEITIGLLAAAAGGGGLMGAAVASWARSHSPQLIVLATLALTTIITIVAAFYFTLWTAVAVALVGAFAQGLGKLALDAIVQREIGEEVLSSTFGVVEALLQIAWVFGGLIGLMLSLFARGPAGFTVMAVVLGLSLAWLLAGRRRRLRAQPVRRPGPTDTKPLPNTY